MKRFSNILVAVDTRADSQPLLSCAASLAKSHGAAIKLVEIAPQVSWYSIHAEEQRRILQDVTDQKQQSVELLAEPFRKDGLQVTGKVLVGKSSEQIIGEVVRFKHDLVMKMAKGQFSQQGGEFGATATQLIRYCPCPIWAFRPRASQEGKIAVAVDATATDDAHRSLNRDLLQWALAVADGAPVHVVHVWSVYGENLIKNYMKRADFDSVVQDAEKQARDELQKLVEPIGLKVGDPNVHLLHGDPDQKLTEFVQQGDYDVLVLGTVARSGLSGWIIGNTAESLIDRVKCSVVAIKPADFQTPIKVP